MSNAKRFLSVVLAIIMVCSTLVIGASAAYNAYKDSAISGQYNDLDKAVLTTEQYASAAMDEVDRMLDEEQLKFTRADIVVGDIDLTSIDSTMDDVYALVNGTLFNSLRGMLGDLQNLSVNAFRPETAGGVRRGTPNKSDLDIIYSVLQFLYDNRAIFTGFVAGTLNLGSIVSSLVDISEFADVNKLLKGLLYEATYVDEAGNSLDAPANIATYSFDTMVQDLIDRLVVTDFTMNGQPMGQYFEGHTNISQGSFYDKVNEILKILYNTVAVQLLNTDVKKAINEFCGVVYLEGTDTIDEVNTVYNGYQNLLNLEYTIPQFNFTSADVVEQLNNIIKTIADAILNPAVYVWQGGANTMIKTNIVNLAKAILTRTGNDFFASYIEVADEAELNAMTAEELTAYALRAIINGSVDEMYIPAEATTIREFGYYTLKQLLATSVPELDFSNMDKNSTDTLIIMGIDYAIYSVNSSLDMGLSYVYTMEGVDEQLQIACQYGIDNFGGLLNGINFGSNSSGWTTLNNIIFSIIPANWLPASANDDFRTFLVDCLVNNILDLDFDGLFEILTRRTGSELNQSPKQVILNRVVDIVNIIFPGALQNTTTIDALASNAALSGTVNAIFSDLWNYRAQLASSILPTLCNILDLTNEQEFEFPTLTYDKLGVFTNGLVDFNIKIRNSSTGINTGWTDTSGDFHQDDLYTYQIISATSSNSAISVTAPTTVAAGKTENIRINGNVGATDITLKVTLLYNVLTETGDPLTSSPIEEDIYCYITQSESIEEATATSVAAGGFSVSDGPLNVFARGMGDITDITLTVNNTNSADVQLSPYSNLVSATQSVARKYFYDTEGTAWIRVRNGADEKTNVIRQVDGNVGIGKVKVFERTEEYNALTSAEKDAVWDSIYENMTTYNPRPPYQLTSYPKSNYEIGVTNGSATSKTTQANLFLYKDFGLSGMVNSELNKHRQASAYTDPAKWDAYQAALYTAVGAVYSPFTAQFAGAAGKASKYEPAAEALKLAILNLDGGVVVDEETQEETVYEGCAASAGVESIQAIINQYNPSNEGIEYDDPAYNYFAVADYEGYTYYNYRDEYRSAQRMIDRATIPDAVTGEVAVINELDKLYTEHRLALYGSRLLPTTATKAHLAAELANPTRTNIGTAADWSAESWAEYQRALTFATAVNNTAVGTVKQSKINTALDKLLEAEKKLCKEGGTEPPAEASYDLVDPTGVGELTIVEAEDCLVLTGIQPSGFEPEEYFNCVGCHVEIEANSRGCFSTGAVVNIIDDTTNQIIETYYIAVYTDINGDCDITAGDITMASNIYGAVLEPASEVRVAADIIFDGDFAANDITRLATIYNALVDADYVNCTTI